MPIVINTNAAATTASFNLSKNADALRKSLARLSSGNRITQPAEDAGGLAVAYKLDSQARRTEAALNNHQNALSYLQVQDGALETVGKVINRMSELRTMAADVTKNSSDIENYSKEFRELQSHLSQLKREKFNGISLFSQDNAGTSQAHSKGASIAGTWGGGTNDSNYTKFGMELLTHPSGASTDGSISINIVNLEWLTKLAEDVDHNDNGTADQESDLAMLSNTAGIQNIYDVSIVEFTNVIQKVADARAENGAEQQRVQQSYELHQTNLVNLEAAHGRIMDVDVALESTRFAKNNVLVQASASMTAQANQLTQVALTLLQ